MAENTPPDPSAPNKFNAAVDERVRQILSNPLALPDPFVSWLTQTISAYLDTEKQVI